MPEKNDKDYEIPVKVVDRRWWAQSGENAERSESSASLKPTYVEELERQPAEKNRQVQEYIRKYRQASNDFEEARLRLRREISKDVERARRDVLAELIEVLDNLDRALDSAAQGQAPSVDALLRGVEMVRRQFLAKLEGFGVTRIEAASQPFDPSLHEAVTTVPVASPEQDGRVVGVIRHGYRVGSDVLRPAAVAVAKTETLTS
jgi:molecular chaperone GrpE